MYKPTYKAHHFILKVKGGEIIMLKELSSAQKRIWYLEKTTPGTSMHNIGGTVKFQGTVDPNILRKAVHILINKQIVLKTTIVEQQGIPFQFLNNSMDYKVDYIDFSKMEFPTNSSREWIRMKFLEPFSFEKEPLFYFAIYKIDDEDYGILAKFNHIIVDGWSFQVLQRDLLEIVQNLILVPEKNYTVSSSSYMDYIENEQIYLKSRRFSKDRLFWNKKFQDKLNSSLQTYSKELNTNRVVFDLDKSLVRRLRNYVKENGCNLSSTMLSVFYTFLYRTTLEEEITIGVPVYNRFRQFKETVGMFTSTVPLKIHINPRDSFREILSNVHKEMFYCLNHQRYPYEMLLQDLSVKKYGGDGLFNTSFNFHNTNFKQKIFGIEVETVEYPPSHQYFPLQISVRETGKDDVSLAFDYKTTEYKTSDIERYYGFYCNILNEVITDDKVEILEIGLHNNSIVERFNSTNKDFPKNKTVLNLFEQQVEQNPDKIALSLNDSKITYGDLSRKVNQVASFLKCKGVMPNDIVGIMGDHSVELVTTILATLKLGAAFLPIDTQQPIERVNFMLNDSNCKILLSDYEYLEQLDFKGCIYKIKDSLEGKIQDLDVKEESNNNINSLAYVIYTSGSTGVPKGVKIGHTQLMNYIWWARGTYVKSNYEVFAFYSSISFDLTITSIFTPLVSGSELRIYPNNFTNFNLLDVLEEKKVTVLKLTPSHLRIVRDLDIKNWSIRRLIIGGEDLKTELVRNIVDNSNHEIEVFNEYGPTETTVGCMIHKYTDQDNLESSVPIGKPIANTQVYILDKNKHIVPPGVKGEIFIAGDSVSEGYINNDSLNSTSFLDNPFIKGTKMYKTGDIGIYYEDAIIRYVGRIDSQVKIRGHRVELGEIEKVLLKHNFIKDAVILKRSFKGENILYAYIICEGPCNTTEIKSWLSKQVPRYMIPGKFIQLSEFPLTPNGKVNKDLLPYENEEKIEFIKPTTQKERDLIQVLEEILQLKEVNLGGNFYEVGGDSIKAIQVVSKLSQRGWSIRVSDFLSKETLIEIAHSMEKEHKNKDSFYIEEGVVKHTPISKWFFSLENKMENYWNQSMMLKIKYSINQESIERVLNKIVLHHDTLRLNKDLLSGKLYYNNKHLEDSIKIKVYDLADLPLEEAMERVKEIGQVEKANFNIAEDLLFKASIIKLDDKREYLLLTAHHLVIDGVSWRIIIEDIESLLYQTSIKTSLTLPPKTDSFKKWADNLFDYSNNDFSTEIQYWSDIVKKIMNFPTDSDGLYMKDYYKDTRVLEAKLDKELTKNLLSKSLQIYNQGIQETLVSALALTITSITSQNDIVIEVERHGREDISPDVDISRTVGWFTSMYPLYLKISENGIESNLKSLKEQQNNVPFKGFNFGIIKFLKQQFNEVHSNLIRFNYLGDFSTLSSGRVFSLSPISTGEDVAEDNVFEPLIEINSYIYQGELNLIFRYSRNKLGYENIRTFIDCYVEHINGIHDHLVKKTSVEFTPSDFKDAEISQEDLDILLLS